MCSWAKSLLGRTQRQEATVTIRRFEETDAVLSQGVIAASEAGWTVEGNGEGSFRLFEIPDVNAEHCMLTYRATLRSENLSGQAYLEMWVRVPGRGEFFSKGIKQPIRGTTGWSSCEIPFHLRRGQRADLVKLNLVVEGQGRVWIKDVELLKTPL